MQSLYEDKIFALQYITATDGLKISYHSAADQTQGSNSALKKQKKTLSACLVHWLDKKQHFDAMQGKKGKKGKESVRSMIQKKNIRSF